VEVEENDDDDEYVRLVQATGELCFVGSDKSYEVYQKRRTLATNYLWS